ncbi:MAG: D-2-hydroxyacid dehydrogenase [Chloroflexi bacterium]|nr:D-2-hydroxyacid dehydrogenase [Chloroflexota bacterium]
MDTIKIVVTAKTDKVWLDKMAALSPRLQVTDATDLARAELRHQKFGEGAPPPDLDRLLAEAEVLYCAYVPQRVLVRAPRLRWVHTFSTGLEHLDGTGLLESSLLVTNARGVPAFPIAEHVAMFMLMFSKNMLTVMANQRRKVARRTQPSSLEGKTVGIVGLGAIGSEVSRLARAFRMRVIGTRRSAMSRQENVEGMDVLYPPQELKALMAESDFVVLALPLTPGTRRLIGEAELRAMKPTAYLINVSRGSIVDETALIATLREGRIAGAGLDVTETEPLPPESPLWDVPNVILTPHEAGATADYNDRVANLFLANLKRYLEGQPLINVVDKAKGY